MFEALTKRTRGDTVATKLTRVKDSALARRIWVDKVQHFRIDDCCTFRYPESNCLQRQMPKCTTHKFDSRVVLVNRGRRALVIILFVLRVSPLSGASWRFLPLPLAGGAMSVST